MDKSVKKIIEPNLKVAYSRILLKMIEKPDPKMFLKCYKILQGLDDIMKSQGLVTVITVSSVPLERKT